MTAQVKINQHALDQFFKSPTGPVAKELMRIGLKVEGRAKDYTPVDTGRARSSISTALGSDSKGLYVRVGSNVFYFIFLELGTRYMRPYAPLRRALNQVIR